jgi:hypothetical protein
VSYPPFLSLDLLSSDNSGRYLRANQYPLRTLAEGYTTNTPSMPWSYGNGMSREEAWSYGGGVLGRGSRESHLLSGPSGSCAVCPVTTPGSWLWCRLAASWAVSCTPHQLSHHYNWYAQDTNFSPWKLNELHYQIGICSAMWLMSKFKWKYCTFNFLPHQVAKQESKVLLINAIQNQCTYFIYIIYLCSGVGAAQEVLWLPTTG